MNILGLPAARVWSRSVRRRGWVRMRFLERGIIALLLIAVIVGHAQTSNSQPAGPLGTRRFMEYCAGCHGVDGKSGAKAASLAMTLSVMTRSDAELEEIVRNGTTEGMPPFAQIGDSNIAAVVSYLRTLEGASAVPDVAETGDIHAGRDLYFGKARCGSCHMVNGEGGFIASDLTGFAKTHSADAIIAAIAKPDTPVARASRVATVTLNNGSQLTGVLRYEDSFSVALETEDGRYHLLSRSEMTDLRDTGHSLMPRDYASRLSSGEMNDIVSFLIVAARSLQTDTPPPRQARDE
jgi:cytochrome c oxidase cbb3-type subunit III